MSNLEEGVLFDIASRGTMDRISWPVNADHAWLAMDRNGNGVIDDGSELFGNTRALASGAWPKHGYELLAELDANGDGKIDASDPEFGSLRLWRDAARDGVCDSSELHSLPSVGIASISLDYRGPQRTDRWGNKVLFRSMVSALARPRIRFAYDVVPLRERR
ncbi:MAG: hypothetical protein GEV06_05185 [Luteitalea sp.]|nr:hypothetical protein [Luteitalea sp.]